MDLNVDNYNIDELLNLFNIKENDNLINTLQNNLSKSINLINKEDDNLPDDKDKLINFYTLAAFKILNNIKNTENNKYLEKDPITNNDNIIKRQLIDGSIKQPIPSNYSINTNINKYSEGLLNPIGRETIKSLLTINSKFRDNYSKSSTDFSVELNDPYNNVVSLKLASMELMNSYYTISEYLRTNYFSIEYFQYNSLTLDISNSSIFVENFTIPDGNYNILELVEVINNDIFKNNDPSTSSNLYYRLVEVVYHPIKGKVNFVLYDASGNPPDSGYNWGFNLIFKDKYLPKRPAFLNFGWILGFKDLEYYFFKQLIPNRSKCNVDFSNYKSLKSCNDGYLPYYQFQATNILNIGFNSQSIANTSGTHYFLLEVDDFNKNQSVIFKSNTQLKHNVQEPFTFSLSNILARIPNTAEYYNMIFEDSSDRVFKTRNYFGPVRLSKFKIRLLDENGVVVNLNDNDIVINLEIETLNSPYKNLDYRN